MSDDVAHPRADELDLLLSMSTRIRAAQRMDPQEIERALEAGFAALIGLEAELSRVLANARVNPDAHAAAISELKARIETLRDALTDLRTLAVPPGEARIGYGFVLPDQHGRAHAHRN
ncbi:MAG TPA: hypothetical protein VHW96_07760 [Solirubrobacteraceae bacterium]|jgi:hypothetical protein|nr:hypothetical protein [Solirubrobacteraceae bacterium]